MRLQPPHARALIFVALFLGAACAPAAQTPEAPATPAWLTKLIAELEAKPVANPPAHVARYTYHGDTVYYLPPRCCDIPSTVYAASGAIRCSADGGMTGRGDGRCPDFFEQRRDERIIWRDRR